MILVGLLTGVLFLAGCAKTVENVSKGCSDSTKDSAIGFEDKKQPIHYNDGKLHCRTDRITSDRYLRVLCHYKGCVCNL